VGQVELPQGRIYTGIIRDLSDRKALEEKILTISEEEQSRIGQDIHDDLCRATRGDWLPGESGLYSGSVPAMCPKPCSWRRSHG